MTDFRVLADGRKVCLRCGKLRSDPPERTPPDEGALAIELQQRDTGFIRILSTNVDEEQGEYEARAASTGKIGRRTFTFKGTRIITPRPGVFRSAVESDGEYSPPEPYQREIAALRAGEATPQPTFEDRWKADGLRELEATREELDNWKPESRLTTAELSTDYAPPDPYKAGLDRMRSEGR